jgi:hypothetical protein
MGDYPPSAGIVLASPLRPRSTPALKVATARRDAEKESRLVARAVFREGTAPTT